LRHFGGDGNRVDVNAVHPGVVDTELPRSLSLNFYPALKEIGGLITPEQGARGQIELAIGDAFENVSGKYVAEKSGANKKGVHEITESSKWSYDRDAAARLWKVSKSMTGAIWDVLGESAQVKI
jgi:NAD(P)-dependent dehydrogenase (short-subunit alcohol dehydrogenase family)|tara:strand:+ start:3798 stop:4169 length:372 start_codon:yes stop_codon:yes gene_type:complete